MARIGFDTKAFFSFIGLLLFGGLIFGGVVAVIKFPELRTKASRQDQPTNMQIVNITGNSASIFWQTLEPTKGFISFGETSALGKARLDDRDIASGDQRLYRNHLVTLRGLIPKSKYYYVIGVNAATFDRNGSPFMLVTTGQAQASTNGISPLLLTNNRAVTGRVIMQDGKPAANYFVTLTFDNQTTGSLSNTLGAITLRNGEYVINFDDLHTADGTALFNFSQTDLINIDAITYDEFGGIKTYGLIYTPGSTLPTIVADSNSDLQPGTPVRASVSPLLLPGTNSEIPVPTLTPSAVNGSLLFSPAQPSSTAKPTTRPSLRLLL